MARVQRPPPLPGLLPSPERDYLARLAGNLGIVLVHGLPQRLDVAEPLGARLDDLHVRGPVGCVAHEGEPIGDRGTTAAAGGRILMAFAAGRLPSPDVGES
jgi:hypothetical protein